jgi:hypothetical protein
MPVPPCCLPIQRKRKLFLLKDRGANELAQLQTAHKKRKNTFNQWLQNTVYKKLCSKISKNVVGYFSLNDASLKNGVAAGKAMDETRRRVVKAL